MTLSDKSGKLAVGDKGKLANDFLDKFSSEHNISFTGDRYKCTTGDYPTLYEITNSLGEDVSVEWLARQFIDLSEYSNVQHKLTTGQVYQMSRIINKYYGYLKITEIMLFIADFEAGKITKFFGNVDPLEITNALKEFVESRNHIIDMNEEEKRNTEYENNKKNHITYEEYLKRKKEKEKNAGIKEHEKTTLEKLADGEVKLLKEE